jgi:nucleotide-binding universal stress UspA family protein
MTMFQRILCPTDFDGNSIEALRLARRLALRDEGKVFLVHVVLPTDPFVISAPLVARRSQTEALAELKRLGADELAGVTYETLVRIGRPAHEIPQVAKEIGADLIVMGTHGRDGLEHLVLGSVAEKVVRESVCPVLTIRAHDHRPEAVAAAN